MSTPKRKIIFNIFLIAALALSGKAEAGLYGFTTGKDPTVEEEILDMPAPPQNILNYRSLMRDNLQMLIDYAKENKPEFQIMLHDCDEMLYKSLWEYHLTGYSHARGNNDDKSDPSFLSYTNDELETAYLPEQNLNKEFAAKVDGIALNNLYCGERKVYDFLRHQNIKISAISQCANLTAFDKAAELSTQDGVLFYGFINPNTAFKYIADQPIINENTRNIFKLQDASNISYLIDDSRYKTKEQMILDIANSNYDVIVIKPLFQRGIPFSKEEVESMKYKKSGPRRLILAMLNVSEAFKAHYYWDADWNMENTPWLARESFVNEDAYITKYWSEEWKKIVSNYFKSVVQTNYDGVFFSGINNHMYFEHQTPIE